MKVLLAIFTWLFIIDVYADEQLLNLEIIGIYQDVYLHKSYSRVDGFGLVSSNGLIVIKDKRAFLIDTPWSIGDTKKLISWIQEKGYVLVGSISTHSHEDRTAGINWLNSQSIPTYASRLTNDLLKKEGKELALNTIDKSEIELFGGNVEVFYPGGGHTIDNLVVWLPKPKILFGGCFVRSLESKSLGYTGEAAIDKWPDSVGNVLLKYPEAKIVVPGHGKLGDIRLLQHTKKLAESASNKSLNTDASDAGAG